MRKQEYDVIIIGAGIGGLTCGCYLAKTGMKVLIVEQHRVPGGYCAAFKRGDFTFQVVNTLENCREDGQFGRILRELGIDKKVEIIKTNPHLILATGKNRIIFGDSKKESCELLKIQFPHQAKAIKEFFNFLLESSFVSLYLKLKKKTFEEILGDYFSDSKLKAFFSFLVGHTGVPPVRLSALTAAVHLRESIFDGGYYPKGGMRVFVDAFVEKLHEFGGELILLKTVRKIKIVNGQAVGVFLENGNFLQSKYLICSSDVTQTFTQLIDDKCLPKSFVRKINNLEPSISVFSAYLGVNKSFKKELDSCHELRYSPSGNIDDPLDVTRFQKDYFDGYIFCYFPSFSDSTLAPLNNDTITLSVLTSYINDKFWEQNRFVVADKIIRRIEEVVPGLSKSIIVKEISTPKTLFKFTLNRNGAMRGWMPTPDQIDMALVPQETLIKRLFLAGHWVTLPSGEAGVPMAGFTGLRAARLVLQGEQHK